MRDLNGVVGGETDPRRVVLGLPNVDSVKDVVGFVQSLDFESRCRIALKRTMLNLARLPRTQYSPLMLYLTKYSWYVQIVRRVEDGARLEISTSCRDLGYRAIRPLCYATNRDTPCSKDDGSKHLRTLCQGSH